ncbi:sensor histidine kinase [Paracoccus aestuariivivens]|uniref:histidine kinase n=1 Tax=Paracoccus aestuariivivens TaxID=1820333 RepID=A0A6L6JDZ7_9RHOB|nr:ATP-binding protein [Paracoccus aestuariivivens]MTH78817.1 two-component sensor histidine kinase [Paracoccus aestuariivivens]
MPDLLDQLLSAVPVPMVVVDEEARLIGGNDAMEALLGPVPANRPFVTLLRHPEVNTALDSVLAGGEQARLNATMQTRNGKMLCQVLVSPLQISGNRAASVTIEDRSRDEETEQMRRDFVANVSHELRTPLTALMGFIETLRGPARNDLAAHDRFLEIMGREAGRMNRLIGELLSLSRVEQDERRRPVESVDLAALLRSVVTTLSPSATSASVSLEQVGTSGQVMLPGDTDQLVQVFHNLIENAVKYGASGGVVRVVLERLQHEPVLRGPAWMVTIADEGEGIEALHLPRLTERFYRVDTHRSREQGGTGLGLAIVKHIINRHRGRLKIESQKGKGSQFMVILPESAGRV